MLEGGDGGAIGVLEGHVLGVVEDAVLDVEFQGAVGERFAHGQQFLGVHLEEADAVEGAQQPVFVERRAPPLLVPNLHGAADELVAARPFHAVDAEVGTADAHGVFRRPGARGVVLGGDQPVAWIDGGGHWCAQVDVAQAHDQIVGAEHDVLDGLLVRQAVDATDELHVVRAPRRILAHAAHVAVDGGATRRVVPRERQMHDARRHGRVRNVLGRREQWHQASRETRRSPVRGVEANQQRADAGGCLFYAGKRLHCEGALQCGNAQPQRQIQHVGAELHEHEGVPSAAHAHIVRFGEHDGITVSTWRRWLFEHRRLVKRSAFFAAQRATLGVLDCVRGGFRDRLQAHYVASAQLPQLPAVRFDDRGGAHETAQARAVRAKNYRHVAGEVDGAEGVGVVVDVGGVQASFAAVWPRPGWARADQPNAGAVRVVVDGPLGVEEGADVFGGEELLGAVRAHRHAQASAFTPIGRRGRNVRWFERAIAKPQHVADFEGASIEPADAAQGERRGRAHDGRHVQAAGH